MFKMRSPPMFFRTVRDLCLIIVATEIRLKAQVTEVF